MGSYEPVNFLELMIFHMTKDCGKLPHFYIGFPHDGAYHIYAEDWGKLPQGGIFRGGIFIYLGIK
jgi:hypothetical protein